MKVRNDFVSNSSSCSFFVGLHTQEDIDEFKKLIGILKEKNVDMQVFFDLAEAHDRWYGEVFNGSDEATARLEPGNYVLIDTGEDHYPGYEHRFWDIKDRFVEGYKFKLYNDREAHMSADDDLPNIEPKDDRFE